MDEFPQPDPKREGHCGHDCRICEGPGGSTPDECTGHVCNWCVIGEDCPVLGDPSNDFCKYHPFE